MQLRGGAFVPGGPSSLRLMARNVWSAAPSIVRCLGSWKDEVVKFLIRCYYSSLIMDDFKKTALHEVWISHACDWEDYVFCDVMMLTLEDSYRFRCTGCLHLQGRKVSQTWAMGNGETWEWPVKGPIFFTLFSLLLSFHSVLWIQSSVSHLLHAFTLGLFHLEAGARFLQNTGTNMTSQKTVIFIHHISHIINYQALILLPFQIFAINYRVVILGDF